MIWEPSDSARLREYHQKSGGKMLALLRQQVPVIQGTTIESVALEAKFKEGCEHMLKQIEWMLIHNPASDDASNGSFAKM
jgi:hypothetical protein